MTHSDTYGYFESIDALREEFSGRIRQLAAFESEYYPKSFSNTLKLWEKFKPEYIILGQHFVVGEGAGMPYSGRATGDEDVLKLYVDTCCEAMKTGLFTYFAHPDLINFVGEGAVYEREIERLIGCCIDTDTPPEINLLGLIEGRAYPRKDFWTLAGKMGATAIIGCDAHIPTRVAVKEEIEAARKLAADSGVLLIDPIDLKLKKVI
jgi:histidinol-phosphatase (PHP family)